ncbi:MAG: malonyl-ACP O-methyltransferase BioC [Methylophilaceae bacterium]|nr:malonyl-ACP O-methyltransferase BioC [Methylophilaceae bacterium]
MSDSTYRLDKQRVRAAFARAAKNYDAVAVLQAKVRVEMLERLALLKVRPEWVLDAGCGTALATVELQTRLTPQGIIALDFAETMLHQDGFWQALKNRLFKRVVRKVCADIEALPLKNQSVDMVWSNLAVQWCDLDICLAEFQRVLRADGVLMLSTFGPDTLHELRYATHTSHSVNVFIDMHDIGDALHRCGLSASVLDVERYVLTYVSVEALMNDLKSMGAGNALQARAKGLKGRSFLRAIAHRYECFRQADGRLPATFEVVYAQAWQGKAQPLQTSVPLRFHPRYHA